MPSDYSQASSPHERRSVSPSEASHLGEVQSMNTVSNGISNPESSRADSPPLLGTGGQQDELIDSEDTVTCLWDNCGIVFMHLPTLIDHIHNDHIGVHKSNYTCEWATCHRRGLSQTSRFALISHIRSHTGEKPFICPLPECDKSFTRSDALAKHMRLQHNIEPPAPGRGGSRKRKRDEAGSANAHGMTPPPPVIPPTVEDGDESDVDYENFVRAMEEDGVLHQSADDEGAEPIPPALMAMYDPATKTILGRSKEMVMYILMKAKLRYAVEQQGYLLEELRASRSDLRREQQDKERLVDTLLRRSFGPEADPFVHSLQPPPGMLPSPGFNPAEFAPPIPMNGSAH
ncbi:hypothetical protein V5O48_007962 [Marasmius crinis-equi]|uniref:C2H2-type domain-containing protein n=1 Tax=Marasmius crinis-equi TaxID=585013 RepID=A0ABR3FFE0_9AGAR